MPRRLRNRKKKRKESGIAHLVEPGYGALYVRTPWITKLKDFGQNTPRQARKLKRKRSKY